MTDTSRPDWKLRSLLPRTAWHPMAPRDLLRGLPGALLLAAPAAWAAWLGLATYAPWGAEAGAGIAFGAAAVVVMAEALILAARPRLLEPLFGGLDRMYRAHKWLGITTLVLMILHNSAEPEFEHAVRETAAGELAGGAGELAFNALLAMIALSLLRRLPFLPLEIPYHWWRFTHRFMGVLFGLVLFHQFLVDLPAGVSPALAWLLNGFGVAGLAAWAHTEFLAPHLRRRAYSVRSIERQGTTVSLVLVPEGRPMRWQPGQFAFVRSPAAGLAEPHPFTLASAPAPDGTLRLAIRALGDWTRRLPDALQPGARVLLEGPYGRFDFRKGGRRQVWLAGGIGITPFLAWADSLKADDPRDIHLVVSVHSPEDLIGLPVLQAAAARNPRFGFTVVASGQTGRLTAARLVGMVPFAIAGADLWFCGPDQLREGIVQGLNALGQAPGRVRFETFDFA